MIKPDAVFFDLDGTLLDTAEDLLEALNFVLSKHNYNKITLAELLPHISLGSKSIIKNLLKLEHHETQLNIFRAEFINAYNTLGHTHTKLFSGIPEVLNFLNHHKIPWGIITNKLVSLTDPIIKLFELDKLQCQTVVCADTTAHAKPHPAPMLKACENINVKPENCIFIGDALTDIQAGQAVNMQTILAAYGYIPYDQDINTWGADKTIQSPSELLELLDLLN
ncbi:MAG: HAD-IA family hydrolase [Gammaproteobacteria bacterium]|nr:HAD-IA family hydrolase [Gammaproteobacteria bacterium]